jgi:hypothetical protein
MHSVSSSVSDEVKSCLEEGTPTTKTRKFQRCWRGLGIKHRNTLPPVLEWRFIPANSTQHETPSQNETAPNIPSPDETQHATSPQNKTEQDKTPRNVTQDAAQQSNVTGQRT